MRAIPLLLALSLTACAQVPELDRAITPELEALPYPELVPLDPLLARRADATITEETGTALENRGTDLQRRADALREAGE